MAFGDDDLVTMFQDMGTDCLLAGTKSKCYMDMTDEALLKMDQTGVMGTHIMFTVPTSDAADAKAGAAIQVDGLDYTVLERMRIGDGALTKLLCTKA